MGLKQSTYGRTLTLTLPSGIKVKARRPSVMSLIASGGFPSEITLEVWKLIKKDHLDPERIGNDAESIKAWAQLMDHYIPKVLVDPKIAEATELSEDDNGVVHGTINLLDITDMDKQVIFLFGNNVCAADEELQSGRRGIGGSELVKALTDFREQRSRENARSAGEAVQPETEQLPGDRPEVAASA